MSVTVFSWSNKNLPGITPMVWADYDQPAVTAIGNTSATLASLPIGKRCLFLWHGAQDILVNLNDPVKIVTEGLNEKPYQTWLEEVLKGIKLTTSVDRVVLDNENGFSYWIVGNIPNWYTQLWANQTAYNKLPATVKAFPLSSYQGFVAGAVNAWNDYSVRVVNQALRRMVTATVHAVFGPTIPVSNYFDSYSKFPCFDKNNWPILYSGMGNEASPACYLFDTDGQRYWNRAKSASWNTFLDGLNRVRNQAVPVTPWITFYNTDLAKGKILIEHLGQSGVKTFFYWNPNDTVEQGNYASQVFASLSIQAGQQHLSELKLDATKVTTKTLVTPYWD